MEWRLGIAALAVFTVVACGGPTASASHSPTPLKPSPSPIPSPSPVPTLEPSPTPFVPSPTPATAVLNCRIPISNGQPGSGGFVVFPGGKFVADPASNVVITGIPTPSPNPYGYYSNFYGLTYDRRYSKWLPVPRNMILTGSNQAITIFDGSTTNTNIYVTSAVADSNGLWLATGDGLYLYRAGGNPEKVSAVSGPIGGPCV